MKISKWYKLLNKLNDLRARSIPIEIFVRDDHRNEETYQDLDQLELEYQKIHHHTAIESLGLSKEVLQKIYYSNPDGLLNL